MRLAMRSEGETRQAGPTGDARAWGPAIAVARLLRRTPRDASHVNCEPGAPAAGLRLAAGGEGVGLAPPEAAVVHAVRVERLDVAGRAAVAVVGVRSADDERVARQRDGRPEALLVDADRRAPE